MKRKWNIRRTMVKTAEAQRNWDCAYQYLLRQVKEAVDSSEDLLPSLSQENQNENSNLCSRFNSASTTNPKA